MHTKVIKTNEPEWLAEAVKTLNSGGLVAFPTDTVYGLAASLSSSTGVRRLFEAKGRESNKAIPVLVGSVDQIGEVAIEFTQDARELAQKFWPGPLTIVVPSLPGLPQELSPTPTIGVRMPDHADAIHLLMACGPLAVTSANISNGPNPRTAADVLDQLRGRIELVLDGGETPGGVPSTVVDCSNTTGRRIVILRPGDITEEELLRALS